MRWRWCLDRSHMSAGPGPAALNHAIGLAARYSSAQAGRPASRLPRCRVLVSPLRESWPADCHARGVSEVAKFLSKMLDSELRYSALKFRVDRECFQRREASANFGGKVE